MSQHGWRLVDHAPIRPQHCAVFPQIGSAHGCGFIDVGSEMWGGDHVYISTIAAVELAKYAGYEPASASAGLRAQVEQRDARIAELEADLAEARGFLQAIDTLESAGLRARRKPGRKKEEMT